MQKGKTICSERGVILAALLEGEAGASPLDRLDDGFSTLCGDQFAELRSQSPACRRTRVTELTQELFSPLPANVHRVHPSWIQHLVDQESPAVIAVAVQGLHRALVQELRLPQLPRPAPDPSPPVRRAVYQLVLGQLEAMPAEASETWTAAPWEELPTWTAAWLRQILMHLGCLTLGTLTQKAGPALEDALLTGFPSRWMPAILAGQAVPISLPHNMAPPVLDQSHPEQLLLQLGVQSAGPSMPQPFRRQAAQLLPRVHGLALLEGETADAAQAEAMYAALQRAQQIAREHRGAQP